MNKYTFHFKNKRARLNHALHRQWCVTPGLSVFLLRKETQLQLPHSRPNKVSDQINVNVVLGRTKVNIQCQGCGADVKAVLRSGLAPQ